MGDPIEEQMKRKFVDEIDEFIKNKTRVLIDGEPASDVQGTILSRGDDYIKFETLKVETEKKSQKKKTTREVRIMLLDKIGEISEGEKVTEVNAIDKALKALEE